MKIERVREEKEEGETGGSKYTRISIYGES